LIACIFRQQDAQTPADEAAAQQAEQQPPLPALQNTGSVCQANEGASQVVPAEPVGKALTPAMRTKEYLENVKKQKAIMKHNVLDEATRVQDEWYNKGLAQANLDLKPAQATPVATPARANTKVVPVSGTESLPIEQQAAAVSIAQPEDQGPTHQAMQVESQQTLAATLDHESVDQQLVVQSQAFEQTQEAVSNHESADQTLVVESQAREQHTQEQCMETESSAPDSAVAQTPSEQNLQHQQPQQDAKYACCTIED